MRLNLQTFVSCTKNTQKQTHNPLNLELLKIVLKQIILGFVFSFSLGSKVYE